METGSDININRNLGKALRTKVADGVKDEIASVLNVNTDKMTAGQAIVYAQVAKAIKGDKNAFETIINTCNSRTEGEEKAFSVEIKVVD